MDVKLQIGPWVGVPADKQLVCAVEGCDREGKPHRCPWDGERHHHGCVHYDREAAKSAVRRAGLKFRPGWALLCDEHYEMVSVANVALERKYGGGSE